MTQKQAIARDMCTYLGYRYAKRSILFQSHYLGLLFGILVPDSELRVPDSELRVPDCELRVPDCELRVPDSELRVPDSRLLKAE